MAQTGYLDEYIMAPSPLGTRPAATAVSPGTLFADSGTGVIYRSDGTIWETYTDPGGHTHTESSLSLADVTTDNVSLTRHGFAPKAPNDATRYLDGTGAYSTPPGTLSGSGTAGQVALWDAGSDLAGDSRFLYDSTNGTCSVTATGSHNAITGTTGTGLAVKGRATGAGGWGVYGWGGGAGASGVVGEVGDVTGIPLIGQAPTGQTADLLQLLVDVAVPFAVGASGNPRWASAPPSSATDTGVAGTLAWDSTHLYLCVATNTWIRVALATW